MAGFDLLFIVLAVLVLGGVFFARMTRDLNKRRMQQPGDGVDERSETPPVHSRVTNEEQPRFQ